MLPLSLSCFWGFDAVGKKTNLELSASARPVPAAEWVSWGREAAELVSCTSTCTHEIGFEHKTLPMQLFTSSTYWTGLWESSSVKPMKTKGNSGSACPAFLLQPSQSEDKLALFPHCAHQREIREKSLRWQEQEEFTQTHNEPSDKNISQSCASFWPPAPCRRRPPSQLCCQAVAAVSKAIHITARVCRITHLSTFFFFSSWLHAKGCSLFWAGRAVPTASESHLFNARALVWRAAVQRNHKTFRKGPIVPKPADEEI